MTWSRKFPRPLYLSDGRAIDTLAAARDFVLELPPPRQSREHWRQAAETLLKAAYRSRQAPIGDASTQIARALETDGLLRGASIVTRS